MRTLHLIRALTTPELKEVETLLNHGKRKNLRLLFKELAKFRNTENEPERSKLFKKVFGKNYNSENEHLLRNKLSRLNETLYQYLATATFKTSIATDQTTFNLWLAKTYSDRKIKPLFNSDVDGFLQDANERARLDEASQLFAILANWWVSFGGGGKEAGKEILLQWREEEKRRLVHRLMKTDYLMAYVHETMPEPGANDLQQNWIVKGKTISVNVDELMQTDWYTRYVWLLKHQYVATEVQKRQYNQELLVITKTDIAQKALGVVPYIYALGNAGQQALITSRFSESEVYLKEARDLLVKNKLPVPPVLVTNYMALLLCLKKYDEAIKLYRDFELQAKENFRQTSRDIIYAFCLLYNGNTDEAMAALPSGIALLEVDAVYCRLAYLLLFIIRGDYPLAINEAANLKKTFAKFRSVPFILDSMVLAGFFKKYATAQIADNIKRKKMLHSIVHAAEFKPMLNHSEIPIRTMANWLFEKIQAESKDIVNQ